MCCCGKPTINGELGYRWQPNDVPSIRKPFPPKVGEHETLLYDEPGRCGGLDCHSHHFRVVKDVITYLLVSHGGGEERIRLSHMILSTLADLGTNGRYWVLHTIYSAHRDAETKATDREASKWQKAAAEKRIKTRKQPKRGYVKVWIEPALNPQQ